MKTYTGSCHCGAVRFEADTDLVKVIECNCSHCLRKGLLLTFVPNDRFRLLAGEEVLSEYRFNRKVIAHLFCQTCGVQPFGRGKDEAGNDIVAVNIRCLDDIELSAIKPEFFDGKNW